MTDLETLLAIEEIKKLKARYFRFLDAKDWQAWAGLFTADAIIEAADIPDRVFKGAATFVEAVLRNSLAGAVSAHLGHCPEIEILSATTARGIWALEDWVRWEGGSASLIPEIRGLRRIHGCGHYAETYERVDGRWLIKTMKLTRLFVEAERDAAGATAS